MFTDTHCHLYKEYYDSIELILNNAKNAGINRFINNGCDANSNNEVLALAEKYPNVYAAIGIHPEIADDYKWEDINFLLENINNNKVVAIGEIGLDYHYTKENKTEQIELFKKQLALAEKYNMPVIIHSREATDDTIRILKEYKVKGVIHSFSGSLETAKEYIKLGFLLGINGVITFKNCKMKEYITDIPLSNIILETDAPYLTPEPLRGHKNEPTNIKYIAEFIAKAYNVTLEELSIITNNNIKRIFDI